MTPGWVLAYQYWVPLGVLILGVLSTGMVLWTHEIIEQQWVSFDHVKAVMDLQMTTATFHLRLEEAMTTGNREDMDKILPDLDTAVNLSRALVYGGESERGTPLPPVVVPLFRQHAENLAALLGEFKEIALKLNADPKAAVVGSSLDKQFDTVFEQLQEEARALETAAEKSVTDEYAKTEHLLFAVVFTWALVVVVSTVGFYRRERRRRRAELALEKAYDETEKRVQARTADLAEANIQLQEEIAERRRTEDTLRQSEEEFRGLSMQFRALLDTIPDRIGLISRDLKVLWANNRAGTLPRAAVEDHRGEYCYKLWTNRSEPCDACPVLTSFSTGKPESLVCPYPDGTQWEARAVPLMRDDGTIENVLEVATDITEKLSLQAEKMRAAHLASIGELAAGVAHEINNPINGIINYAQILCNKSVAASTEREIATRIVKEGSRIGGIVRGLLTFARERKEEKALVSVAEILAESLALIRSQMEKEGISVLVDEPAHPCEIVANPQQIQQVFLNIISNARYALNQKYPTAHDDKVLEIRGEWIALGGVPHVRLTFHDRGEGIPAHLMDKVMEPFFSTKPSGLGTGLGLSISHGIVADHCGRLAVESVEGEFTKVIIDLPARASYGEDTRH
jgi:two-component system, NtrC family, sensor kinase